MRSSKRIWAAALVGAWLASGAGTGAIAADIPPVAPQVDRNAIRPDPAVRRGVLPNGLRYAVMRNATPAGGVTVRLAIDAGSLNERDEELGLAHFVEHMAFNGTRRFPEDGLDGVFAPLGVAFGRDHNATTDEARTLYRVDLKGSGAGELDLAFRWLRDVADGMLLAPDAVARERGVVLAEREAHNSPDAAAHDAINAFRERGLRVVQRNPIGTLESVATATPERLRGFYQRWYRPDNAMVVVVGDAPVEDLERRIGETFGDWKAIGPAPPRPALAAPDAARGIDVQTLADARLAPEVSVCRLRPPEPPRADDVARLRRKVTGAIWRQVLQRRLDKLAHQAPGPVLAAGVWFADSDEARTTCLSATPVEGRWTPALAALQLEVRRLEAAPPTEAEIVDVVLELRSGARGAVASASTRPTAEIADELVEALLDGAVFATAQDEMRALNMAMEDLTPAEVKAAFDADWTGAGPLISVLTPESPPVEAVRTAWAVGGAAPPPAAPQEIAAATWRYPASTTPGRILRREEVKAPGFVRIHFANGVVLNFRQTAFAKGEIRLRATFGAGRAEIAERDQVAAIVGAQVVPLGGLGRNSYDEIETLMRHHEWGLELDVEDDAFVMDGAAMPSSLMGELAILAAYFTDPGFRPAIEPQAAGLVDAFYNYIQSDPEGALTEAMVEAFAPERERRIPARDVLRALKAPDYARLLRPALTEAPVVLTLVGDVEEAVAVEAVARTFGTMPPRTANVRARSDVWRMRYPPVLPPMVRAYHQGPADKAAVVMTWPLYVDDTARRRETFAITVAAWVLEDQLRLRVRERLGKTYAPQAAAVLPDDGGQGALTATIETRPTDVPVVLEEMRRVAAELAAGGVSAEMIETVRRPVLKDMEGERRTNDWWLTVLGLSGHAPEHAARHLDARDVLAAVTLADVRKAAADWLSRPAATGVSIPVARQATNAQGGAR